MVEPKDEQELVSPFTGETKEPDFDVEVGAYTVSLRMSRGAPKEYLVKVADLTEEDEEVAGKQTDPFSRREFKAGDRVYRLTDNTEKGAGTTTYNLESIMLLNPDLKADSFTPIPEGEVRE